DSAAADNQSFDVGFHGHGSLFLERDLSAKAGLASGSSDMVWSECDVVVGPLDHSPKATSGDVEIWPIFPLLLPECEMASTQ
ncbi:MAG: hypothetical protein HKO04_14830, partial [Silicimonas sp.]|nr:hypothetical protein [Silicimonas sp.]